MNNNKEIGVEAVNTMEGIAMNKEHYMYISYTHSAL